MLTVMPPVGHVPAPDRVCTPVPFKVMAEVPPLALVTVTLPAAKNEPPLVTAAALKNVSAPPTLVGPERVNVALFKIAKALNVIAPEFKVAATPPTMRTVEPVFVIAPDVYRKFLDTEMIPERVTPPEVFAMVRFGKKAPETPVSVCAVEPFKLTVADPPLALVTVTLPAALMVPVERTKLTLFRVSGPATFIVPLMVSLLPSRKFTVL